MRFAFPCGICISALAVFLLGAPLEAQTADTVDFDSSGFVDFEDFLLFAGAFGGADSAFDLDSSGVVDFPDFLVFASHFGQGVPERLSRETFVTPAGTEHEMILVAAGDFLMGSDSGLSDQRPAHEVFVDSFFIDVFEVTNQQFVAYLNSRGTFLDDSGNELINLDGRGVQVLQAGSVYVLSGQEVAALPVVQVTWLGARAYCEWMGGRLPYEAEWEKAARGIDGRKYPWGNSPPDSTRLNCNGFVGSPTPVGNYDTGVSPFEIHDLSGNVFEWVSDHYAPDYYAMEADQNPMGPESGMFRTLRGGSYPAFIDAWVQTTYRLPGSETEGLADVGFRCVRNP